MNITEAEFKWMVEMMTADLIQLLIERENYEFVRAFEVVYNSDTYRALIRPEHFAKLVTDAEVQILQPGESVQLR